MQNPLLETKSINLPPDRYLHSVGTVFAEFGANTQDSGNISYGVQIDGERYFVKTAGLPDDARPYLDHAARVGLLRNAVRMQADYHHPILLRVQHVIESPYGPLLVYPWFEGELLGTPRAQRDDPRSPFQRFRSLPASNIESCLDEIFDLHVGLSGAGWIAVDFYDGALMYNFESGQLRVMDLETYRDAPFHNEMGRMFGSTRFMAPEEFELGALIDERTTVFVMGRTALIFLSDGTLNPAAFRGSEARFAVVSRACAPERSQRFDSMSAFYRAWREPDTVPSDPAPGNGLKIIAPSGLKASL